MNYNEIIIQKQKIMGKFNTGNVDAVETLEFIANAEKAHCFAIADDMKRRLGDHVDKKDAGIRSWKEGRVEMGTKTTVRCIIIDPVVENIYQDKPYVAIAPEESLPHIGKYGIAEIVDGYHAKITLDDGNVIYGDECWWKPVTESKG